MDMFKSKALAQCSVLQHIPTKLRERISRANFWLKG